MLKDIETLVAPAVKLAELNKATLEKFVADQQAAAKELVALTESRLNAAMQIRDIDGLKAFIEEQVELAKTGAEKAVATNQALLEDAKAYGEEVAKLFAIEKPVKAKRVAKRPMKVVEPVVEPVEAA